MNNAIQFHTGQNDDMTEVMRITRDDIWVNPYVEVDEAAKAVLDALSYQVKVLVQRAVGDEREACAKVAESYEPTCDLCPRGVATAIRSRGIDGAKVGGVGVWGEKPPVKTYCGGKPNYCTPEVTGEVDETAKREWVGLTVNEAREFYEKYTNRAELIYVIDKFLEEKNT